MKGYPDEKLVRALRDAWGLGGSGVERNAAFNEYTLRTARDSLLVLAEIGWVAVPRAAAEAAGLLPAEGTQRKVPADVR